MAPAPSVKKKPVSEERLVVEREPTKPEPVKPEPVPPPSIDILLGRDIGVYREVADKLVAELGERVRVFILTGDAGQDKKILDRLASSENAQIAAIGPKAADAVSGFQHKQIVFAYVFRDRQQRLVKQSMKGVSTLPGAKQLFADWKAISPTLKKVAVLSGGQLDDYMRHAAGMAEAQQIKLLHFKVNSDKEFLYRTKTLAPDIQGQWIIPDHRILSRKVLKDVLTFNAKEARQTVVFSPSLLKLGGLFYSAASTEEVAEKILNRLRSCEDKESIPGDETELLDTHQMGINAVVARRLGLTIPRAYQKYRHE